MRVLLIFALSLTYQVTLACTKDTDCKGDRICVSQESGQGQCQAPTSTVSETSPLKEIPQVDRPNQDSLRNIHLNLLGVLQFGITPSIEWGTDITVIIRARLLNTGVLSYLVANNDGGELTFGLGTSAQARKYFSTKGQQGPYLGGGVELMYTQTEGDETWETYFLVPQIEGGVRWQSEGYFTGFGLFGGVAIPVNTVRYNDGESVITGGLIWDVGWYF